MLTAFAILAADPEGEEATHSVLIPEIPDLVWGSIAFFLILGFMLWRFVPLINKALDARTDAIEGGIKRAEEAQAEAARIVAAGQAQIEAERSAALVSLRSEVGTLALDLASGVLGESLTDDKKAGALVDRFLADMAGTSKGKAGK